MPDVARARGQQGIEAAQDTSSPSHGWLVKCQGYLPRGSLARCFKVWVRKEDDFEGFFAADYVASVIWYWTRIPPEFLKRAKYPKDSKSKLYRCVLALQIPSTFHLTESKWPVARRCTSCGTLDQGAFGKAIHLHCQVGSYRLGGSPTKLATSKWSKIQSVSSLASFKCFDMYRVYIYIYI